MKKSLIFSFSLIGQVGLATSLPLVLFGLLGRVLDKRLETAPYLFLGGLGLATVLVYFVLKKIIQNSLEKLK